MIRFLTLLLLPEVILAFKFNFRSQEPVQDPTQNPIVLIRTPAGTNVQLENVKDDTLLTWSDLAHLTPQEIHDKYLSTTVISANPRARWKLVPERASKIPLQTHLPLHSQQSPTFKPGDALILVITSPPPPLLVAVIQESLFGQARYVFRGISYILLSDFESLDGLVPLFNRPLYIRHHFTPTTIILVSSRGTMKSSSKRRF